MSTFWNYHGEPVHFARHTGDVPKLYQPHQRFAALVQTAINAVALRRHDREAWATIDTDEALRLLVVPAGDKQSRIWAQHVGHTAAIPQVSPFIKCQTTLTHRLTVHLAQRGDGTILLVRAYPGEYQPPLPWQNSARNILNGYDVCRKFWRTHAYVYSSTLVVAGTRAVAPDWF